ncbi:MAG TPA: acyl carrier protein [Verrucomicrobiota bacterium]|nr:acyl carrier protein [Verrucomicrobiales bacterium]HRI13910.1 acyl carrier protein [Verrucomicrobiota bacterium]
MNDLKTQIRQFVVSNFLFGKDNGLTDETSFLEQGILDSTGVMELVAHLEETFRIKIADHELVPENLDSINAVAVFLERKRASAPAA